MDNKDVNFSSSDIKRAPELITRVKKTKPPLRDRIKAFIKKHKKAFIISGSAIVVSGLAVVAVFVVIEANRPEPLPPTTEEELRDMVDQVNTLDPDLSNIDIANEEKEIIISQIEQKAERTEDAEDKTLLDFTKSSTLFKFGDYDGAIANHMLIIASFEADKAYSRLVEAYAFVAKCYEAKGDKENAIKSYEKALSYFDTAIADQKPITNTSPTYYQDQLERVKNS